VNVSLVIPNGNKQEPKEKLQTKAREQWVDVPNSEFITSLENVEESVCMNMKAENRKGALLSNGLSFDQKLELALEWYNIYYPDRNELKNYL
jgi:hypothetical protein